MNVDNWELAILWIYVGNALVRTTPEKHPEMHDWWAMAFGIFALCRGVYVMFWGKTS